MFYFTIREHYMAKLSDIQTIKLHKYFIFLRQIRSDYIHSLL